MSSFLEMDDMDLLSSMHYTDARQSALAMPRDAPTTDVDGLSSMHYTDGKALMMHGTDALVEHFATRAEAAMGKALPQMEVRFNNITLTVERKVAVKAPGQERDAARELPTIANVVRNRLMQCRTGNTRTTTKHILNNVSGVFKPGTMTLILGRPGSGKSALMKLLSGRFPMTKSIICEGDITYNGMERSIIAKRLPQLVSYVTQRDNHFATLTARETLEFAHECCGAELSARDERHFTEGSPEENKAALKAARALYKHYPEVVIHQLGLSACADTIVGDDMLRGISGGERKRVTTGEMEMGNKFATLMDEISTGLDSAATYDIVNTQRSIARKLRKTVVIALLQPSPEVFALFDNVLLLNEGRVMYNGPRNEIVNYFEAIGFHCPPNRDVADFLLDLGTDQQSQYFAWKRNIPQYPRTSRDFAHRFVQTSIHQTTKSALHTEHDPALLYDVMHHFDHVPEFRQAFWASTWTLVKREIKVLSRNKAFLMGRAVVVTVMGTIYAILFYQFNPKKVQVVMGTIFPAILFFALGQSTQIPLFMAAREIYYKQRAANFYRTTAYVLAVSVGQIPMAFIETMMYSSVVYWVCGFANDIGAFLIFELVLFVSTLAFSAWFFFLSASVPDVHMAEPLGMLSMLVYILFAGFIITQHEIPVYFQWVYWCNPVAWAFRSLAINQYRRDEFDQCDYGGVAYCGLYGKQMSIFSLETYQINTERYWIWYGIVFLLMSYAVFMRLAMYMLENVRFESHDDALVTEEDDDGVAFLSESSGEDTGYGLAVTPRENQLGRDAVLEVQPSIRECYFLPVTVAFKDLWYSVPKPGSAKDNLDLLKGINGFALPGTMTALMGSSGAGKTTLMDLIAGRKSGGIIRGEILLNGHPASQLAIQRVTGYCEQTDIHSGAATIREALMFSAFLRLGSNVPEDKKIDSVEDCLDLLDLRPIADQIIRGSSVEQMKRITIGVELAAQPSVLFLDEPTSGLDARSAKVIMDGVRKVAYTGRTVMCTIHQPSQEVFHLFDSLLLLKRGGETVYFGELGVRADKLIRYFESIPGTPRMEKGYNPATWMLEVIGAGVDNSNDDVIDFSAVFNSSEHKRALAQKLERVAAPMDGVGTLDFSHKRAASELTQAKLVIRRFMDMFWRTPSYNVTRFVINAVLGLLFGLAFANTDYKTFQGINAAVGMIFVVVVFLSSLAFKSCQTIAAEERAAFYRERASQTYNTLWYFVGITVVEIPYVFFSAFLFSALFFPLVGLTGFGHFLFFWLNLAISVLLHVYLGQLLVFVLPSLEVAAIAGVMVSSIFFIFAGFNPPADVIPKGYLWLYHLTPPKYTLAIVAASLFGDCPTMGSDAIGCTMIKNVPPPFPAQMMIKQYLEEMFWIKHDEIGTNFVIVLVIMLVLRALALLAMRFCSHQKR